MNDRVLNATQEQLTVLDELAVEYRHEFMKPDIIGCTWQYFLEAICDEDTAQQCRDEYDYNPVHIFYFGRVSASGYLDASDWTWDEDFDCLVETIRELYPASE